MSITIENPTAEEIIAAIKAQIPPSEFERMKELLSHDSDETAHEEEAAWRVASASAASRFFDEEDNS